MMDTNSDVVAGKVLEWMESVIESEDAGSNSGDFK